MSKIPEIKHCKQWWKPIEAGDELSIPLAVNGEPVQRFKYYEFLEVYPFHCQAENCNKVFLAWRGFTGNGFSPLEKIKLDEEPVWFNWIKAYKRRELNHKGVDWVEGSNHQFPWQKMKVMVR